MHHKYRNLPFCRLHYSPERKYTSTFGTWPSVALIFAMLDPVCAGGTRTQSLVSSEVPVHWIREELLEVVVHEVRTSLQIFHTFCISVCVQLFQNRGPGRWWRSFQARWGPQLSCLFEPQIGLLSSHHLSCSTQSDGKVHSIQGVFSASTHQTFVFAILSLLDPLVAGVISDILQHPT